MLEHDIGSVRDGECSLPGMFLRPGERPIIGVRGQVNDVGVVVDALVSCVGWKMNDAQRENVERVYLAQPEETRMDSYGIFPSRSRAIRLAIMGFKSRQEICSYLESTGWPGQIAAVDSVISRFKERVNIVRTGASLDVQDEGVGPTLGLTLIVKQRYTKDSRYWLDGLTDWDPFLEALSHEDLVVPEKLKALAGWVSKPTTAFCEVWAFCPVTRHSPHQARDIWKSTSKSQGLCVHGAFRSGFFMRSTSNGHTNLPLAADQRWRVRSSYTRMRIRSVPHLNLNRRLAGYLSLPAAAEAGLR